MASSIVCCILSDSSLSAFASFRICTASSQDSVPLPEKKSKAPLAKRIAFAARIAASERTVIEPASASKPPDKTIRPKPPMVPKSPIAARIASGPRIVRSPLPIVAKSTDWSRSNTAAKIANPAAAMTIARPSTAITAAPIIEMGPRLPRIAATTPSKVIIATNAIPAFNKPCQGIPANIVSAKATAMIGPAIASNATPPIALLLAILAASAINIITPLKATIAARRESQGSCARTNKDAAAKISGAIIAIMARIPFQEPFPALFAILTAPAIATMTRPIAPMAIAIEAAVLSSWSTGINCNA